MINKDRIIPIQKCDFLSMIGIIMFMADVSYTIAESLDAEGNFSITESPESGTAILCNEPVKTLEIADGVAGTVYFVPANSFTEINLAGAAVEADVHADGITFYKAVVTSGSVSVTAVTPMG